MLSACNDFCDVAIARAPATAMENVVARYRRVMPGKFTADALCRRAWRPPCSRMGRLASPSAPAPPWSSSAIVRTSRSTSRSQSTRSACQSLRAANRPATRNERNTCPCRASSPPPGTPPSASRTDSDPNTRPSGRASSSSSARRARRSRSAACCKCLDSETGGSSSRWCPRRCAHIERMQAPPHQKLLRWQTFSFIIFVEEVCPAEIEFTANHQVPKFLEAHESPNDKHPCL